LVSLVRQWRDEFHRQAASACNGHDCSLRNHGFQRHRSSAIN
jgi:hypothetical protein